MLCNSGQWDLEEFKSNKGGYLGKETKSTRFCHGQWNRLSDMCMRLENQLDYYIFNYICFIINIKK